MSRDCWDAQPPSTSYRSDGPYLLGFAFSVSEAVTVTQLGRLYIAGNTESHTVSLFGTPNLGSQSPTLLTSASVQASASTDSFGINWTNITPINLTPGNIYILVAYEGGGAEQWQNSWSSAAYLDPIFSNLDQIYQTISNGFWSYSSVDRRAGSPGYVYDCPALQFGPSGHSKLIGSPIINSSLVIQSA
jgi:hypothetical protein